jgi:beta-lactam-binding protein with PASTA domain
MNKTLIAVVGLVGVLILGVIMVVGMYVTYSNKEVRLRNALVAKQTDNKNEMDNMWKQISQVTQVTDEQKKALVEIFSGYASARTGNNAGASLAKWVKEAVPNVDQTTFRNLQNIIASKRDGFVMRQKELLDLKREHDNVIDTLPGSLFVGGRGKINVVIVTSGRTEDAFQTGQDNDVSLRGNQNQQRLEK